MTLRNEGRGEPEPGAQAVGDTGPATQAGRLVFLHGFLGHDEDWDGVLEHLEDERDCRIPVLPGHGPDPDRVPEDFDATVAYVHERLDTPAGGPVDVVGYSMGGRLAYGLLCAHPDDVRRAVVIGGHPGLDDQAQREDRRSLDEQRAASLEISNFGHWLLNWYLKQPLFEGLAQSPDFFHMIDRRRSGRPAALANALRAYGLGRQPPLRKRLAQCPVPALLVAGSLDEKYTAINRELAAANPRFQAVTVPGAGHAPHLEKPDEFVALVREFLAGP